MAHGDELQVPEVLAVPADSLVDVRLRCTVELGRASVPVTHAVGLPPGAIVDLDRSVEEPVDVYVGGRSFAKGRLVVVDGEWAVQLESVSPVAGLEQASSGSSEA